MREHAPAPLELEANAGPHRWRLIARVPASPAGALFWLPALGVAARHYLPFADALATRGIAVFVHEWRGLGTSNLRAGRQCDWGYPAVLLEDIPASLQAIERAGFALSHLGGHSLGGQLACCTLALWHAGRTSPQAPPHGLWLVASGAPYWRAFPPPLRYGLPLAYRFLPWLAQRVGALPGRLLAFGGNEARTLIRDWARTGLSGRYAAEGIPDDLEAGMAPLSPHVVGIVLRRDRLAPRSSLDYLLDKLPRAKRTIVELDGDALGTRADHFAWMKRPDAVVDGLLSARAAPALA